MTLAANLAALARRVVGLSANNLVALDGAGKLPALPGDQLTGLRTGWDFVAEDQKAAGSDGGAIVVGWQRRQLNTAVKNTIGAVLAGDGIGLLAGSYEIEWFTTAFANNQHRSRLQYYNGGDVLGYSNSGITTSGYTLNVLSVGRAELVTNVPANLELQMYSAYARSDGCGRASSSGSPEIFTRVCVRKLA